MKSYGEKLGSRSSMIFREIRQKVAWREEKTTE
jgi:hypothetical protein